MDKYLTPPSEKEPKSTTTVVDQGQGGLEEKTRSISTTQTSIDLTKDDPPTTTPKSQRKQPPPSETAEDGARKGPHLLAFVKRMKVSKIYRIYLKAWKTDKFGNKAFETWKLRAAEHHGREIPKCPGYWADVDSHGSSLTFTYDQAAFVYMNEMENTLPKSIGTMVHAKAGIKLLFPSAPTDDDDDGGAWALREFFLRLATQCPTVVFDLASAQREFADSGRSPCFWEFSSEFDPVLIVERDEPLTWMWLMAAEFFAHPWTGPAIAPPIVEEFERLQREAEISKSQVSSKKRGATTPTNPKGAKAQDSRPSPSIPMNTDQSPKVRPKLFQRTPPGETPPRRKVQLSNNVHVIAGSPPGTGTQEATALVAANPSDAVPGAKTQTDVPTYRDAAAAPAAPPAPLTTDERLLRLLQVHWPASPFRNIRLFNTSIVFDWQGTGATNLTQVQTAYQSFRRFAAGIWGEMTSTIVLLPLADSRYQRQQLWIRNLKDFDRLAPDWTNLKTYLDPNFGNPYILNKADKTGSKTYKSRMRFGFDDDPSIVMQGFRSVLVNDPRAGVFKTPIQVSDMVRIGFLSLLPQELVIEKYCKDLMRLCEFEFPIGLMQEWVNNPRFFSATYTVAARGILLWHVYVPRAFARAADALLAANLDQRKLSSLPYHAPTHYIRDWQAAKDELVNIKQSPQLQKVIEAMKERSRAMRVLTATHPIPIEIPGLLTSAKTEHYGEITLLRFLLAVIVTGDQAKKAEVSAPAKAPPPEENSSDSESSGDDDSSGSDSKPTTFNWQTVIKKSLDPSKPKAVAKKQSVLTPPKKPEDDGAWINELQELDLTNDDPSPLFVMVLPGAQEGSYFVVVRQRYLALAVNVLDNLPAFLQFHLREPTFLKFIGVLKSWTATDVAYQNRKRRVEWDPAQLRSRCTSEPVDDQGPQVRDPMDFLLLLEDPTEILEGTLHIDIHANHARDVDDGLTVLGHLDDWNESQAQLQSALQTIAVYKDETAAMTKDNQLLRDELEALKAAAIAAADSQIPKSVEFSTAGNLPTSTTAPTALTTMADTGMELNEETTVDTAMAGTTIGDGEDGHLDASSPMEPSCGGEPSTTGP